MSIYDEMLDDPSMIPDTETVNPNPPNPEDFQEQGETGDLQPIGPNTPFIELNNWSEIPLSLLRKGVSFNIKAPDAKSVNPWEYSELTLNCGSLLRNGNVLSE